MASSWVVTHLSLGLKGWEVLKEGCPLLPLVAARQKTHPLRPLIPRRANYRGCGRKRFVQGHLMGLDMNPCLLDSEATEIAVLREILSL